MRFKCPICKGKGFLEEPSKHKLEKSINNKIMAQLLRKAGYSIRQIMRYLNYKSTRSITELLKK